MEKKFLTNLDEELKSFDYSLLSAAREPLLQDLLTMRSNRKKSNILLNHLMTDDELDYVAAAGGDYVLSNRHNTKVEIK